MNQHKILLDTIAEVVAHPHKTITEHDKIRAAKIFMVLQDYFYTNEEVNGIVDDEYEYIIKHKKLDFGNFLMDTLTEDEWGKVTEISIKTNRRVNVKEILKNPEKKQKLIEGVVEFFKRCRHWF